MNDELFGLLGIDPKSAREKAFTRGLLSTIFNAAALSGPQARPVGGVQALGQLGLGAMEAYESSFDRTLKEALSGLQTKGILQQLEDAKKKREREQRMQQALSGAMVERPVAGLGLGAEQVASPITQAEVEAFGPQAYMEAAKGAAPTERVVDRNKLLSAIAEFAPEKYLELTQPKEKAIPASIQEYNLAVNQGYKGSFQDFVLEQKKAGAPSTNITLPGDKKLTEVLGSKAAERLDNSLVQAQEAQSTLQNISELRPILAQGVFSGPLSAAPRAVAQIATQLGITGKDTKELLDRTAVAMQGLAKFELSAAAAMRGQGAITENERMLIQRAAAGRLDQFTSGEVQALLTAMEKTANFRIQSHNKQLDVLRRNPSQEVKSMVPFYELQPFNIAPTTPSNVKQFNPATGRVE